MINITQSPAATARGFNHAAESTESRAEMRGAWYTVITVKEKGGAAVNGWADGLQNAMPNAPKNRGVYHFLLKLGASSMGFEVRIGFRGLAVIWSDMLNSFFLGAFLYSSI